MIDAQLENQEPLNGERVFEINFVNVLKTLDIADPGSAAFSKAVSFLESRAVGNTEIVPLREMVELDTHHDEKIMQWLSRQVHFSRSRSSHTDSRSRIALTAWLLGSPKGTLFSKTDDAYHFVNYVKSILLTWEFQWNKEREVTLLMISKLFNTIINSMEIRMPNPSSHDDLRNIYTEALNLIDYVIQEYRADYSHDIGMYNEEMPMPEWREEDSLMREMHFLRAKFINNYLVQLYGWSPTREVEAAEAITHIRTYLILQGADEELINIHQTTHDFRLNRSKAMSHHPQPPEMLDDAISGMVKTFYQFYYRRVYHNILALKDRRAYRGIPAINDENNEMKAFEEAYMSGIFNMARFLKDLSSYHPHKMPEFLIDIVANQAELDAFTSTLKALPKNAVDMVDLSRLLSNILGSSTDPIAYHPMDNCQGYVLAIIDEILGRMGTVTESGSGEAPKGMGELRTSIERLETYLMGLPQHPMHVNLSGSIRIRLANLYTRFEALGMPIEEAETRFIKGFKLFCTENIDKQKRLCESMAPAFLTKYLTEHDHRIAMKSGSRMVREPFELPASEYWQARIGLELLLESANFREYETTISLNIAEQLDATMFQIRLNERNPEKLQHDDGFDEFAKSPHHATSELLEAIAEKIATAYDGIFEVSIARAGRHQSKMGDFRFSDEVDIGFGFTARIEYPVENAGMIENRNHPDANCPQDIHQLFTGVVSRRLREHIVRISDPKLLAKCLSPAERAAQQAMGKNTDEYFNLDQYALFHQVFVAQVDQLNPVIYHQEKYDNRDKLVASEILVRFQHPDLPNGTHLPLEEAFMFLDLFEQYESVSRKIIANAIEDGVTLGYPFAINIKCEDLVKPNFGTFLIEKVAQAGRESGNGITIELLESSKLDIENGHTLKNLTLLKKAGFHFALDDFRGTDDDYDKFYKLRGIRIAKSDIIGYEEASPTDIASLTANDITSETVLDGFSLPYWRETINVPILGIRDEVKFDYTNKATLQLIHEITLGWEDRDITFLNISKFCEEDIFSPIYRLMKLLSYCKTHGIKYTIEQIRDTGDDHLLRIAKRLGFIIQGFYYHVPSPVKPEKPTDGSVQKTQKMTSMDIDVII